MSGSGTGGSAVVVEAGATLSGTGSIIPTQSVQSRNTVTISGTLSGGLPVTDSAPGILTIGSPTTPGTTTASLILTGTELTFYHNTLIAPIPAGLNTGASGTAGTAYNQVRVHGSFTDLDPTSLTISLHGDASLFSALQTYSYKLVDADTMVNPFNIYNIAQFDVTEFVGFNPATHAIFVESSGQDLYLNIVPEPSSFILLGSATALLGMRRRRKG